MASESGTPTQPGLELHPSKLGPEMDSTAVYLKSALQNNAGIQQLLSVSLSLCTGASTSPFGAGTVCLHSLAYQH